MATENPKITNVQQVFDNVPQQGKLHTFSNPLNYVPFGPHVQGIARYGNYFVVCHNLIALYDKGFYAVINAQETKVTQMFWSPDPDYPHPGGMQVIGDYLVAPVEGSEHEKSRVHFYDLSTMTDTNPPTLLSTYVDRPAVAGQSRGAGAAGMTSYTVGDTENYLLAVYDNGAIDFYQWQGGPVPSTNSPSVLFSVKLKATDYSAVCLLTNTSQKVFLVGFHTKNLWGTDHADEDWAALHVVDLDTKTVEAPVSKRHMVTTHGSTIGPLGVHFRYGAGLAIIPGSGGANPSLKFYATARNFVGLPEAQQLAINGF